MVFSKSAEKLDHNPVIFDTFAYLLRVGLFYFSTSDGALVPHKDHGFLANVFLPQLRVRGLKFHSVFNKKKIF